MSITHSATLKRKITPLIRQISITLLHTSFEMFSLFIFRQPYCQGLAVRYTIIQNEQLGIRISQDTFTCRTLVLNFTIHQQSHKIAEMILHHPPKLSPPCIFLQIKLTDVLASSVCLNSQEINSNLRQNTSSLPSAL